MNKFNLNKIAAVDSYLKRIGAEMRGINSAIIKEERGFGYWQDTFTIKFDKDSGNVTVKSHNGEPIDDVLPTSAEAEAIKEALKTVDWPKPILIDSLNDPKIPDIFKNEPEENRFVFRNERGEIVMLQVRVDGSDGKKNYIPITLWSDGEYRHIESGDKVPLYGLENLKDHSTVLIVEGAKTARYVQWLVDGETAEAIEARDNHPWGNELQHICVLGWCSGALSPNRTDWKPISKAGITRAYVALDNDSVGRSALSEISKNLRCVTHSIEFSDDWPVSADLFDPFPEAFFKETDGKRYYVGPSFYDCVHPATWMTDLVPVLDGKTEKLVPVLRHHAKHLWQWIEETGTFCYLEKPSINKTPDEFDTSVRPFSHAKKTSDLLQQQYNGRVLSFDYSPATNKRKIIVDGKSVINLYEAPSLKPQEGNAKPWLDFMEQLLPNEEERRHMLRWIATLYARPETRMIFAPLLISHETGTGKSTLGKIAEALVGRHNASFPSEQTIAGEFNSWIARKRLVVVNEVYQGKSWKMFTKLKDMITEPTITLRKMFHDPVDISNWAHFLMFSNSFDALKIDDRDRRIFVPEVTEERWGDDRFTDFYEWLDSGGYSIIANWALNFGDYVKKGEKAPDTERKREIVVQSLSDNEQRLESWLTSENVKVIGVHDLIAGCCRPEKDGKIYMKPDRVRQIATGTGLWIDPLSDSRFDKFVIGKSGKTEFWRNALGSNTALGNEIKRQYPLIHKEAAKGLLKQNPYLFKNKMQMAHNKPLDKVPDNQNEELEAAA